MRRIIEISGTRRGRLLNVGSASGFFGVAAREAGFEITCIEPDVDLAAHGSKVYGLTFVAETLENCSVDCERYDVITLWGTNSVLLRPLRSFEQLVRALKPSGVLAMNTQDFDHWIRRIFPRLMIGWNVMFNLSNRSLDVLMRELGLTLIHSGLEWQTVAVDRIFRVLRSASACSASVRCHRRARRFISSDHRPQVMPQPETAAMKPGGCPDASLPEHVSLGKFDHSVSLGAWAITRLLVESFLTRAIHLLDRTVYYWEIVRQ